MGKALRTTGTVVVALGFALAALGVAGGAYLRFSGRDEGGWAFFFGLLLLFAGLGVALLGALLQAAGGAKPRTASNTNAAANARIVLGAIVAGGVVDAAWTLISSDAAPFVRVAEAAANGVLGVFILWGGTPLSVLAAFAGAAAVAWRQRARVSRA